MWKVNDQGWFEVAAGIRAQTRGQYSMKDSWTVCSALNGGTLHVIFLKVNITIFSYIPWQSRELWVCGDSAVGDINPTEKAGWHIFYTVSSSLSLQLPTPSPRGRAERRRGEEPQESLWVSGQISHEGEADSFLRNACIFWGVKKKMKQIPCTGTFFFGLSRARFISTVTYCIYYSCGGGMTSNG